MPWTRPAGASRCLARTTAGMAGKWGRQVLTQSRAPHYRHLCAHVVRCGAELTARTC
jgi:hypothetical protein